MDAPRQVDFKAGEVRLDPETTKNREGRVFPMTDDLRALLEARYAEHQRLKLKGQIVPWVFFRMVASKRDGPKEPRPIKAFNKAWATACLAAGCPGRIPHDLRRTAVRNMVRRGVPGQSVQSWATFLRNHASAVLACDFFVVVTATFQQLYVFVVLDIATRRVIHWNVTDHPTAEWTIQQFRDALPLDMAYRFVVHDRDGIFATRRG